MGTVPPRRGVSAFNVLLFVYAATLPLESLQILGFGTLPYIPAAAMVAYFLFTFPRGGSRSLPLGPLAAVGGYLIWNVLSYWWSVDPAASTTRVITLFALVAVYLACVCLADEKSPIFMILGLAAGGLGSLPGLVASYRDRATVVAEVRPTADGANANDLGALLALTATGVFGLALTSKSRWPRRILLWVVALMLALGALLTGSRTALFVLIAGCASALWLVRKSLRPSSIVALAGALAMLVVWFRHVDPRIAQRLLGAGSALDAGNLNLRGELWRFALEAWGRRPALGWGSGTSVQVLGDQYGVSLVTHSAWFDVLLELGAVGLLLYALIWGVAVKGCLRTQWRLQPAMTCVLIGTVLASSTLSWDYRKVPWLLLGVLAHAAARGHQRSKHKTIMEESDATSESRRCLGTPAAASGWGDRRQFAAYRDFVQESYRTHS